MTETVSVAAETPGVRVVIADDAPLIRAGVVHVLTDAGISVQAQVGTVPELLAAVAATEPDIVITDIRMPPSHRVEGLDAAITIARRHPKMGILLLSNHAETRNLAALMDTATAGFGYLLKERVVDTCAFVSDVTRIAAGGTALDPEIVALLLARQNHRKAIGQLSDREREVLAEMATGASNSAICASLHLSTKTVEAHTRSIFQRLNLADSADENRRVKAVLTYLQGS